MQAISRSAVYKASDDIVVREIQGVVVIVPLVSGIGDTDDELFTLNDTGKAVWDKIDGRRTLNEVIKELTREYDGAADEIRDDVLGIVEELVKRKMLVKAEPFRV